MSGGTIDPIVGSVTFGPTANPGDCGLGPLDQHVQILAGVGLLQLPPVAVREATPVGDLNSDAPGTGARKNSGKPRLDLIPLQFLATFYESGANFEDDDQMSAIAALSDLALFQSRVGNDQSNLIAVVGYMGGFEAGARVLEYGLIKYKAWNWAKGMPWSVCIGCAARHLVAILEGEVNDAESGLPHRGHVVANVVMLLHYLEAYPAGDDRDAGGHLARYYS